MIVYPYMRKLVLGEIPDGDADVYKDESEEQLLRLGSFLQHPASVKTLAEVKFIGGAQCISQSILISLEKEQLMLSAWLQWFEASETGCSEDEKVLYVKAFLSAFDNYVLANAATNSVA